MKEIWFSYTPFLLQVLVRDFIADSWKSLWLNVEGRVVPCIREKRNFADLSKMCTSGGYGFNTGKLGVISIVAVKQDMLLHCLLI